MADMTDSMRQFIFELLEKANCGPTWAYGRVYDDAIEPGDIALVVDDWVMTIRVDVITEDIL